MLTELEELVEFLHHGNTQIRQIAVENLVPYSKSNPRIFKSDQLAPVKDLKLLVRDYTPIAKNALTILINITSDPEVLKIVAEDDAFLETILSRLSSPSEPTANALSMLLANLTKSSSLERLIPLTRSEVPNLPIKATRAITQLIELYNLSTTWNKQADFDHLAYVFADLAKYPSFLTYLTTPPSSSSSPSSSTLDPLSSFLPHTTHTSPIRRTGTALLLRNISLAHPDPLYLLQPAHSILPPILLSLCSSNQENISEEEMDMLPEECQYLPPTHHAEQDEAVLGALVETLYLLAARAGVEGRLVMRGIGTYVVVRELHLRIARPEGEGEGFVAVEEVKGEVDGRPGHQQKQVEAFCERISNLLMGGGVEEKDGAAAGSPAEGRVQELPDEEEKEEEDTSITPIF